MKCPNCWAGVPPLDVGYVLFYRMFVWPEDHMWAIEYVPL